MPLTENERFKELRLSLKLSQMEMANKLDVEQGTISGIENGKTKVSSSMIFKLKTILRVSPEWIKEGIGPKFSDNEYIENKENKSNEFIPSVSVLMKTIDLLGRTNEQLERVLMSYETTIKTQDRIINDFLDKRPKKLTDERKTG